MRWSHAKDFSTSVKSLAAAWWENDEGARSLIGERRPHRALQPPAASFAQVNAEVAVNLRKHVMTTVSAYSPKKIVDAYSGAGDTAIAFARRRRRVIANRARQRRREMVRAASPGGVGIAARASRGGAPESAAGGCGRTESATGRHRSARHRSSAADIAESPA